MEKELYAQLLEDEANFSLLCQEAFDSIDAPKTGFLDKPKLKSIMMEIAATYHKEMPQDPDVDAILSSVAKDKKHITFDEFKEMVRKLIHAFLVSEGN